MPLNMSLIFLPYISHHNKIDDSFRNPDVQQSHFGALIKINESFFIFISRPLCFGCIASDLNNRYFYGLFCNLYCNLYIIPNQNYKLQIYHN